MPAPHVGRPLKRVEDPKLITGRDAYVNDVRLDGALTMAVVRSPHAHAEIESIDVDAARRAIESATIGSTPAVANAVMDALAPLGVTHLDLPLTAPKIWAAIRQSERR